ncbi:hypothetical protein [Streptomyces sp. NPDC002788]
MAAPVAAGADPGARFGGAHGETPLHRAASDDDVPVLDALVAAGADIDAPGAVIGGGSPPAAVSASGAAAHRLVEHGARVTSQDAAALGLLDRDRACVEADEPPSSDEISRAFRSARHGGQPPTARYLHDHGADIHRIGHGGMTPPDIARPRRPTTSCGGREARA